MQICIKIFVILALKGSKFSVLSDKKKHTHNFISTCITVPTMQNYLC